MLVVKVLKRKDAASVVVAVVVALVVHQLLQMVSPELASKLSGLDQHGPYSDPTGGWKSAYLFPTVWAAVQLVFLEVLCWVYVLVHDTLKRK